MLATRPGDRSGGIGALPGEGEQLGRHDPRTQGDYEEAVHTLGLSLSIYREIGDRAGISNALPNLGHLAHGQADYPRARRYLEESLTLADEISERDSMAHAMNALGLVAHAQGDIPGTEKRLEDSLALFHQQGNKSGIASALLNLGLTPRRPNSPWGKPGATNQGLETSDPLPGHPYNRAHPS
jgi:tetratricopeptide (TPR) repeat protein